MFPEAFVRNISESLGKEAADLLVKALQSPPEISVRRNPDKISRDSFEQIFKDNADGEVKWNRDGLYLKERPSFIFDPLLHGGAYYVQEASSMFIPFLLQMGISVTGCSLGNLKILDLCAAPGGKSTSILPLIDDNSLLVANEVIRSRAAVLAENISKWGRANVIVSNNDPRDFASLKNYFDVIIVDAPCSGEGMFRKDANARDEWSEDSVSHCASRQRRILADVWPALKDGGILLYSTCTFNRYEDGDIIEWVCSELGADTVHCRIEEMPFDSTGILQKDKGFLFVPGKIRGEGFYCSILQKNDNSGSREKTFSSAKRSKNYLYKMSAGDRFIREGYELMPCASHPEFLSAYPASLGNEMRFLEKKLRSLISGVIICEVKGKNCVPTAELALSSVLNREAFPYLEMTAEQSIDFLSKHPVACPDLPKGYVLVGYHNLPLGFINNIGTRTNNLYPNSWRIRKSR